MSCNDQTYLKRPILRAYCNNCNKNRKTLIFLVFNRERVAALLVTAFVVVVCFNPFSLVSTDSHVLEFLHAKICHFRIYDFHCTRLLLFTLIWISLQSTVEVKVVNKKMTISVLCFKIFILSHKRKVLLFTTFIHFNLNKFAAGLKSTVHWKSKS